MPDLNIKILLHYSIGLPDTCALQTCSALLLRMSNPFHIFYPVKYHSLPFPNCVVRTFGFIALRIMQHLGPYFWAVPVGVKPVLMLSG